VAVPDVRLVEKHHTQTVPSGAIPRQMIMRWPNSVRGRNRSSSTTAAVFFDPPPFHRRITRPSPARLPSPGTLWSSRIRVWWEEKFCAFAICFPVCWRWRWA